MKCSYHLILQEQGLICRIDLISVTRGGEGGLEEESQEGEGDGGDDGAQVGVGEARERYAGDARGGGHVHHEGHGRDGGGGEQHDLDAQAVQGKGGDDDEGFLNDDDVAYHRRVVIELEDDAHVVAHGIEERPHGH